MVSYFGQIFRKGNIMSKVKYTTCDICGKNLMKNHEIIGYRKGLTLFFGTLFNRRHLDICFDCLSKLPKIKENIELRDKVLNEIIKVPFKRYDDPDLQNAYLFGVQDTIQCFEKHMLGKSK